MPNAQTTGTRPDDKRKMEDEGRDAQGNAQVTDMEDEQGERKREEDESEGRERRRGQNKAHNRPRGKEKKEMEKIEEGQPIESYMGTNRRYTGNDGHRPYRRRGMGRLSRCSERKKQTLHGHQACTREGRETGTDPALRRRIPPQRRIVVRQGKERTEKSQLSTSHTRR